MLLRKRNQSFSDFMGGREEWRKCYLILDSLKPAIKCSLDNMNVSPKTLITIEVSHVNMRGNRRSHRRNS